jgi:hypothetical protein
MASATSAWNSADVCFADLCAKGCFAKGYFAKDCLQPYLATGRSYKKLQKIAISVQGAVQCRPSIAAVADPSGLEAAAALFIPSTPGASLSGCER